MTVSRKKYILILAAAAAAFALFLLLALVMSRGAGSDSVSAGEHPLRISEYMSNNTAYPNADGILCDWVEIENTSDRDFNVSGYRLTDDITQARYAFPIGTVIPAHGYVVVYCTPEKTGGMYAPFSLKKQGGETLLLMNSANTVLDETETLRGRRNCSIIRLPNGNFTVSVTPSPGFANTAEGHAAFLEASGQGSSSLRISEVMSAAKLYTAPNGTSCDWIEVENASGQSADISGMHLSDKEGELRYTFPEGTVLTPGGFAVVWCSGDGTEGPEFAAFRLGRLGESVILSDVQGSALDRVQLPYLADDTAYARQSGEWVVTANPTPGFENSQACYTAWVASKGLGDLHVEISELCPRNSGGLRDADGEAHDWIELHNAGFAPVSLDGWYLSDSPDKLARWRIQGVTLEPGEYLVIFASGKDRREGELHTDFSISAGETVTLMTSVGTVADRVECPLVEPDHAWVRDAQGVWTEVALPTPGR